MFVKSDIRRVSVVVEKIYYREVCIALGRQGFIQLSGSPDSTPDTSTVTGLRDEETRIRGLLSGIEYILHAFGIEPGSAAIPERVRDTPQDEAFVSGTKNTIDRAERIRSKIQEESAAIREHISCLEIVHEMGIDPGSIRTARLVKMIFGTVENLDWQVPAHEGFMVAGAGRHVIGAALPPDFEAMTRFLKAYGFTDRSGDLVEASPETLAHRLDTLRHRQEILESCLDRLKDDAGQVLQELHGFYSGYEEILHALRLSAFSSRAMFLSGWIDLADKQRLLSILREICADRFIAVVSEKREPEAPVRLMNRKLLRPFELLVKTMGMPANSEIDPTPLTALTFVLMFGLMFGDLGQGLVLALIGLVLERIAHNRGASSQGLGQIGKILIACGISAALCGLLYGSVFSSEQIIPALWFHPIEHIMSLFAATILIGALFIAIGLCVNIINSLMNSHYTEAFFEKRGLVVLVLYAAIVLGVIRYTRTGEGPAPWEAGVFIAVPLLLFSLRGVLGPALFSEPAPQSITEYCIETCVEILETGLSMLSNTISFIRVGAFALSHAGLSIVTYTLAGIADPAMRSPGAIAIIIGGNIFIIGFEGLVCSIQSMRLEYYEFFSKFFRGDGVAFTPFILKGKSVGGAL